MLNQQIENELGGFVPPDPYASFWTCYSDIAPGPDQLLTKEERKFLSKEMAKPYDRREFGIALPAEIERRLRDRRQLNVRQGLGRERRMS